ncbi:unnamed protein product [Lampetra planeri]
MIGDPTNQLWLCVSVLSICKVRKTLEQIRSFTEHKTILAEAIQDENDHLKDQLRRLISHQDAQISEVSKMLYQQGLTELIPSSPSEQASSVERECSRLERDLEEGSRRLAVAHDEIRRLT